MLNYCTQGRCELILADGTFFYLEQGDLVLSGQMAQNRFVYPQKCYQGLELYFEPKLIRSSAAFLSHNFALDLDKLWQGYCGDQQTLLAQPTAQLRQVLAELTGRPDLPSLLLMRLRTLELLGLLAPENGGLLPKNCSYFTRIQVELAKQAQLTLSADLRRHYPARILAAQLGISESSLKHYFRGVYGQSMAAYQKSVRLREAALLLTETRLPIAEIAAQVGYANQGKFAAVFKEQYLLTPLTYRRQKQLKKLRGQPDPTE
ncbi:MAG: AraC family transcriptional regulator [Oscillospiraceae bacterium]|nr:AraC family transcriptional regulator [Oscillospiraceae bacterium]